MDIVPLCAFDDYERNYLLGIATEIAVRKTLQEHGIDQSLLIRSLYVYHDCLFEEVIDFLGQVWELIGSKMEIAEEELDYYFDPFTVRIYVPELRDMPEKVDEWEQVFIQNTIWKARLKENFIELVIDEFYSLWPDLYKLIQNYLEWRTALRRELSFDGNGYPLAG